MLGAPLGLTFIRGTYGPYAPTLGRTLARLEGHYLTGLGDRTARVMEFAPINPVIERVDEAERFVDGFETPYSLELLATVHFAARHTPPTADPDELAERIASWSLRKARMFAHRHVTVAARRLAEKQLLPSRSSTVNC